MTTKSDLDAIGISAALNGMTLEAFIAKLNVQELTEKERKIAIRGFQKFAK